MPASSTLPLLPLPVSPARALLPDPPLSLPLSSHRNMQSTHLGGIACSTISSRARVGAATVAAVAGVIRGFFIAASLREAGASLHEARGARVMRADCFARSYKKAHCTLRGCWVSADPRPEQMQNCRGTHLRPLTAARIIADGASAARITATASDIIAVTRIINNSTSASGLQNRKLFELRTSSFLVFHLTQKIVGETALRIQRPRKQSLL